MVKKKVRSEKKDSILMKEGGIKMHELTKLIYEDMKPALGVTEPGAIAYAVAKAASYIKEEPESVHVSMNSGMYKNAFTCGIPNSTKVGNVFAAALGAVAGDAKKGLEALADVKQEDNVRAEELIQAGKVSVSMSGITSRIFIEATVKNSMDEATVTIRDSHTNITKIVVNGRTEMETENKEKEAAKETDGGPRKQRLIHTYTLQQIYEFISVSWNLSGRLIG